jgi:ADP-heptose:LPS heptosyltransferase
LSELLTQQGHQVVVMDIRSNRCNGIHGEPYFEKSLMEDFRLIKSAKLVIANDSGVSHIAGLLGTPFCVISGWMPPDKVYSMTDVNYVYKNSEKDPYRSLNLITVDDVMEKIKPLLSVRKKDKAVS